MGLLRIPEIKIWRNGLFWNIILKFSVKVYFFSACSTRSLVPMPANSKRTVAITVIIITVRIKPY